MTPATRQALAVRHMPLAKLIAGLHARRVPWLHGELQNEAFCALAEAATRYNEKRGTPFEVYAKHRICGACVDALRRELTHASRVKSLGPMVRWKFHVEPEVMSYFELHEFFDAAMVGVSADVKQINWDHWVEGQSTRALARAYGKHQTTIMHLLESGRAKLRQAWHGHKPVARRPIRWRKKVTA